MPSAANSRKYHLPSEDEGASIRFDGSKDALVPMPAAYTCIVSPGINGGDNRTVLDADRVFVRFREEEIPLSEVLEHIRIRS